MTAGWIHGQLPPPLWMPTLCPSLRGSGLGAAEVGRAILEVHELKKSLPAPYHEPQVIRAMILQRLEALLHEGAPQ